MFKQVYYFLEAQEQKSRQDFDNALKSYEDKLAECTEHDEFLKLSIEKDLAKLKKNMNGCVIIMKK